MELSGGQADRIGPPLHHRLTGPQLLWLDVAAALAAFAVAVFRVSLPHAVTSGSAPAWAPLLEVPGTSRRRGRAQLVITAYESGLVKPG